LFGILILLRCVVYLTDTKAVEAVQWSTSDTLHSEGLSFLLIFILMLKSVPKVSLYCAFLQKILLLSST